MNFNIMKKKFVCELSFITHIRNSLNWCWLNQLGIACAFGKALGLFIRNELSNF